MKRLFAAFCALVMVLSVVSPAVFAAEATGAATNGAETFSSLQAAVDGYTGGVIVLQEDAKDLVVTKDVYVDLNGHDIAGVTVEAGTLYCMDSETDDYTVKDGVYGKLTGEISGNVAGVPEEAACAEHGYLKVTEEEGISFHCVNLKMSAMSLRASEVGVYYKSYFAGDELVAANVESFGVALSVIAEPDASNLDTYCGYSVFKNFRAGEGSNSDKSTGTLLRDIMKVANTDKVNSRNANMPIYGRAYIKTADGYLFGATAKRSLKEQVEAIDTKWSELVDTQRAPISAMYEKFASVMNAWNIPGIKGIDAPSAGGVITVPMYVPAKNGVVTEDTVVSAKGVSITVPAGTKLAEGVTVLTLTVTPKETSDVEIDLEDSQVLMPMDVHVDGIAADNTAPLTIYLGKVMAENLNMGNYTVYHVENGKANEMELIAADEEFTAHNQYKYTLDGELTLYMATFSDVLVVSDEENKWNGERDYEWYNTTDKILYIRNADQLAGFGAIVGGMDGQAQDSFAGKTVILLADISIGDMDSENKIVFYPIGYNSSDGKYEKTGVAITSGFYAFEGTFDGNGNTISDFYQNTWEMKGDDEYYAASEQCYRDGMGLFGKLSGATVKNLTVDNFKSDGEYTTTGVIAAYADSTADASVTFENIVITNSNPRVYNIGNGGIVGSVGWYSRNDQTVQPIVLKNITVDDTNTISALWGSWDVGCGGLVGRYYPDAYAGDEYGILLENCYVAATIDVNNDVCGNYQYYWYRYCGMVIGTVEKSTPDGGADLTGIKAVNCIADFGNRHEYYYCEFVKNSQASYTHDYQFSRVPHSELNYNDLNDNGKLDQEEANTVACTHDHEAAGKETINGVEVLKENNQAIYLPFRQLFGGNGWGIKGVAAYPNIQITTLNASAAKFDEAANAKTEIASGVTITIGELFAAKPDAGISGENVQVFVSPADPMDLTNTAAGTYVANKENWTKGTLTFSGMGAAKVTISDYNNCVPTTLEIVVKPVAELNGVKYASAQEALAAAADGDTVTLLENVAATNYLDIKMPGQADRHITLDLAGHTITPAANYKYEYYPLVFVGVNQNVTITNGAIIADEHVAVGVYGTLTLENVTVENVSGDEIALCIWNWGEDDTYWEDYQDNIIGVAYIKGNTVVEGGMLAEGVVRISGGTIDALEVTAGAEVKISGGTFGTEITEDLCAAGYIPAQNDDGTWTVEKSGEQETVIVLEPGKYVIVAEYDGKYYALPVVSGAADTQKGVEVTIADDGKVQGEGAAVVEVVATENGIALKIGEQYLTIPNATKTNLKAEDTEYEWTVKSVGGAYEITSYETDNRALYFRGGEYMTFGAYSINNKIAKDYVAQLKLYPVVEEDKPEEKTATITFDDTEKRTEFSAQRQVWEENGITVTNNKDKSTSNVADYANPARFYKNSTVIISGDGRLITKIVIDVAGIGSGDSANWKDSLEGIGAKVEQVGNTYVATFTEGKQNFAFVATAQIRANAITVTYAADGGSTEPPVEEECKHTNTTAIGEAKDATCTEPGMTAGEKCADCGETITEREVIPALEHNYVDGTCKHCGEAEPTEPDPGEDEESKTGWYLVTDVSELAAGDQIVIVAKNANYALSTTQNGNNRGQASVTKSGDTITFGDDVQILTLADGKTSGTFAFSTGNGYLYAASSSSNYLRTETTLSANSSWSISIADGVATIKAQGSNTRNWLRYNSTNNPPIFSAYGSGQADVAIYKYIQGAGGSTEPGEPEIPACTHSNTTVEDAQDATCTAVGATGKTVCDDCGEIIKESTVIPMLEHTYVNDVCSACGAKDPDAGSGEVETTPIAFNLGANGSASHNDGTSKTTYTETLNGYTLSITGGTSMYTGARDEKGNSCIKLGTSSKTGGFTFTVPSDVTSVKIYVAKYKANTTKLTVNGTSYTLSNSSNDGAYDVIEVDTSVTKTVTLTTVSGGVRAMVNTIEFLIPKTK